MCWSPGAYWELRARLDEASGQRDPGRFLRRLAGTYQEDRLRNDWLLQLGAAPRLGHLQRRVPEVPHERRPLGALLCADDRVQRRQYRRSRPGPGALARAARRRRRLRGMLPSSSSRPAAEAPHRLAARAPGHGERPPARRGTGHRPAQPRLGRARPARIYTHPSRYLDEKLTALLPRTKELVTLALIRLATEDPALAAAELNKLRWKTQLTQEERSWVWGVIGKRAAQRLSDDAIAWFENGQDKFMHEDHLAWKVRAALRAGNWPQVLEATAAMSERHAARPGLDLLARARTAGARPQRGRPRRRPRGCWRALPACAASTSSWRWRTSAAPSVVPERPAPLTDRGKGGRPRQPGPEPRAARDPDRSAQRGTCVNGTTASPARQGRHGRPRTAGCGRPGLPARGLGPLHQHQRAHPRLDRFRAAFPDAAPRRGGAARAQAIGSTRPMSTG
jgi:soluble lytic murein transglycosylase